MVLAAVMRVGEGAYAVPVCEMISRSTDREVSLGAVYATLDRLERKGLVRSFFGEATPERGGKPKRYFAAEPVRRRRAQSDARRPCKHDSGTRSGRDHVTPPRSSALLGMDRPSTGTRGRNRVLR